MSNFPSAFNMAAGIESLSTLLFPLITDPLWSPEEVPNLEELAMMPNLTPMMLQRDNVSGREGFIPWEFSEYFLRMVHWKKGDPRQPFRGGYGGTLRLDVKTVQATEELNSTELWPFLNTTVLPLQQKQMLITVQRVMTAFNEARIRDRVDFVLVPLVNNTFTTWDGEFLISENHTHPDGALFSNGLIGGTPIVHMTNMTPPTRVDLGNPTVLELYRELVFIMSYNSIIRQHITRFQKVQRVWDIEVIVKDQATLLKMQELNSAERARFVDPLISENSVNQFAGNISTTYDSNLLYPGGEELDYFVIPKLNSFRRKTGTQPNNVLGLQVWNPVPRPLIFGLVRSAVPGSPDTHFNNWLDPDIAQIGIWEQWAVGGGFGEEIVRMRPVQT